MKGDVIGVRSSSRRVLLPAWCGFTFPVRVVCPIPEFLNGHAKFPSVVGDGDMISEFASPALDCLCAVAPCIHPP